MLVELAPDRSVLIEKAFVFRLLFLSPQPNFHWLMLLSAIRRLHWFYRTPCFCSLLLSLHVRISYCVSNAHYHRILTFIFVLTVAGLAAFVAKEISHLPLNPIAAYPSAPYMSFRDEIVVFLGVSSLFLSACLLY